MRILAFVIALAWISTARAEDVANKPELHVGDVRVFQANGENEGGKVVNRLWRRRIEEILPDGTIRVSPRLLTDLFDSSWNPIIGDHPEQPYVLFKFPMHVGDAWSFASPLGAMTPDGRSYENRGSMKVVTYESVTVPAGTFKCFRVEGEVYWNGAVDGGNADWRATEKWHIINWYCPEVRSFAKQHTARHFWNGAHRELDHELVTHLSGKRPQSKDASDAGK